MKHAKTLSAGLLLIGLLCLTIVYSGVSAQNSFATSDNRDLILTTTPLPTAVVGPIDNQIITVGDPLPHADISPHAITSENVASLAVAEQLSDDYVFNIAFTRDGRLMGGFAAEPDRPQFTIWDVDTLEIVATLDVFGLSLGNAAVFSPDGAYVVFSNMPNPGWIEVWSIETNRRVRQYQGGTEASVGFSESGEEMWAVRQHHHQIWNFADGAVIADENDCLIACSFYNSAYSRDWSLWAGMWSSDTMRLIDFEGNIIREEVLPEAFSGRNATFGFSPNGRYLTINHFFGGDTYIIDLDNPDTDYLIDQEYRSKPVDWSPDESMLLLYEDTPEGSQLVFWDVVEQTPVGRLAGYRDYAQFTPDGRYLVVTRSTAERSFWLLAPLD